VSDDQFRIFVAWGTLVALIVIIAMRSMNP